MDRTIANRKKIDKLAISALNTVLGKPGVLLMPNLADNDKTPGYDGNIQLLSSDNEKLESIRGTVPVQVKGTQQKDQQNGKYKMQLKYLRHYLQEGGCMFLRVCLNESGELERIFYKKLLPLDIREILTKHGKKKTATLDLDELNYNDSTELICIFEDYCIHSRLQAMLSGDNHFQATLGINGERLTDTQPTDFEIILPTNPNYRQLSKQTYYLYEKVVSASSHTLVPRGFLTVDAVEEHLMDNISVDGITYFHESRLQTETETPTWSLGAGITTTFDLSTGTSVLRYHPQGTLAERIRDLKFLLSLHLGADMAIGSHVIRLQEECFEHDNELHESLRELQDIQIALMKLDVKDDLNCDLLEDTDWIRLFEIADAMNRNKGMELDLKGNSNMLGRFTVGNLTIFVAAKIREDGKSNVESLLRVSDLVLWDGMSPPKQGEGESVPGCLLLKKEDIPKASNLDLTFIQAQIEELQILSPILSVLLQQFALNLLHAFDITDNASTDILNLALKIWYSLENTGYIDEFSNKINILQTLFRMRELTLDEDELLMKMIANSDSNRIKCAGYILLEKRARAQQILDTLSDQDRKEFEEWPIATLLADKYTENAPRSTLTIRRTSAPLQR